MSRYGVVGSQYKGLLKSITHYENTLTKIFLKRSRSILGKALFSTYSKQKKSVTLATLHIFTGNNELTTHQTVSKQ